jgi:DNA invertase Pin-like site-specific DNA recombinase
MRKLGYIRTSTDDQLVDRQLDRLREVCDRVFIEDGVSALRAHRPVYNDLMRELAPGDTFVVSSLDRAFRSSLDALTELERLHKRSVQFVSLSQNFDATTPDGKFLYTIAAALAAWERDILSQRTKEGLAAARRRGKVLGRPRKLTEGQIEAVCRALGTTSPSLRELATSLRVHERTLVRAIRDNRK